MIRDATHADVPDLLAMAKEFAAAAYPEIELVAADFMTTCNELVSRETGVLLVSDRGMLGALIYPMYFNAGHLHAQELFWWDRGGEGAQLRTTLEDRARDAGAATLAMLCVDTLRPEAVAAVYGRAGYRPGERSFIKVL